LLDFQVIVLMLLIFGPGIEIRDKSSRLRFKASGLLFGIVECITWLIEKFRN
jgi:hypothetical protein